ncbi:hypothetical protein V2J09_017661 [Rumex salicifolius]
MTQPIPIQLSFVVLLFVANPQSQAAIPLLDDILNLSIPVTSLDRLPLPSNAVGPDSIAFDSSGGGPYSGVTNGRILKWSAPSTGFLEFAVTEENWSKQLCQSKDVNLEPTCGRPLGIEFYNKTNTLYIADAYYDLRSVGLDGGVATLLASSAEGVPFKFLDAIEVDQDTGVVYFTDASSVNQKKDIQVAILTHDTTGRLMKYEPTTKQVTVLLRNLAGPAGAALSKDGTFVLVSEFLNFRILRYWLKGPKANTSEVFYVTPGAPDNIKRNADGDFWVAVSIGGTQSAIPLGILLGQNGQVLRVLNFATAGYTSSLSNVQEYNGRLYLGSMGSGATYIAVTRSTSG